MAPVAGGLRAVHRQVLLSFAALGHAPEPEQLEAAAVRHGRTAADALADLHASDFIQLDEVGAIRAAYPFSEVATPHVVQISGGPHGARSRSRP